MVGSLSCEFTMYYATTDDYGPQRADFAGVFVDETTIVGEAYVELWEDVSFIDWTATYDGETLSSTVSGTTQWFGAPSLWPVTWTTTFTASR